MGTFWIIFAGVILLIILGIKATFKEQDRNLASDNPYLIDTEVKYLTGLPDKLGNKEYSLKIYKDKMLFSEKYNNTRTMTIPIIDVKESRIVTESYIREQISLGKMLAFGVFSLAMKKKEKKETNNYLQLTINYQGKNEVILFEVGYDKGLLDINNTLRSLILT